VHAGGIKTFLSPVKIWVIVTDRSGGGNHYFLHLQWIANDVRKAEKT